MEIIHAYIPPEVEGWRSVEETLVSASTPFLSCAAPSSRVCFVLLCCRRFLLPLLAPSCSCLSAPVLVGFCLVASFQAFFASIQRIFFFRYISHFQIFFLCSGLLYLRDSFKGLLPTVRARGKRVEFEV
jgi:hypothetical protein